MKTTTNSDHKLLTTQTNKEVQDSSLIKSSVLKSIRPQKSMMRVKSFKPKTILSPSKIILKKNLEL